MKLHNTKLFLGLFILLAYISIGIFGLFQFSHMSEKPMASCPYTQNSDSVCENNFDHINNWRQFSSTIFPSLFAFSFLIFGIILYFFGKQNFLKQKQYFYSWKYYLDNEKPYTCKEEIVKWLSLFENSPSLSYVRHS